MWFTYVGGWCVTCKASGLTIDKARNRHISHLITLTETLEEEEEKWRRRPLKKENKKKL